MKLYDVPPCSKIIVLDKVPRVPVAAADIMLGDVLIFHHIDGMYSLCKNIAGEIVHLAAWTEVEIVK